MEGRQYTPISVHRDAQLFGLKGRSIEKLVAAPDALANDQVVTREK